MMIKETLERYEELTAQLDSDLSWLERHIHHFDKTSENSLSAFGKRLKVLQSCDGS